MSNPTGFWFNLDKPQRFEDINKVTFTSHEQDLIKLLLTDIDETTYRGRLVDRDSILAKLRDTMSAG